MRVGRRLRGGILLALVSTVNAAPAGDLRVAPPFRDITMELLTTVQALNLTTPPDARAVGFYYPLRARPRLPGLNNLYLNVFQRDKRLFLTSALLAVPGTKAPTGAKIVAMQLDISGRRKFLPPRGRSQALGDGTGIYRNFKISQAQLEVLTTNPTAKIYIYTTVGPRRVDFAHTCRFPHKNLQVENIIPSPHLIDSFCDKLRYALATNYLLTMKGQLARKN